MGRVRYQVAASLDGFIAGPNGEFDWIVMDPEIDFAALVAEFDTLLMGRHTFELVEKSDRGLMLSALDILFPSGNASTSPMKSFEINTIITSFFWKNTS